MQAKVFAALTVPLLTVAIAGGTFFIVQRMQTEAQDRYAAALDVHTDTRGDA